MSNELMSTFDTMMAEAKTLVDSGFLPKAIRTPAQALAIMTMSKELGIGYWTGFNGINVISGKPTISPQLMLALIYKRHPEAVIQINGDNQSCTVFMQRKDGQSHTETFTIQQAAQIKTKEDDKTIPLTEKYNWRQQPAVMLKWRAVAACARVIFPDVIMGFYGPEEINPDVEIDYTTGELIQEHPELEAEITQVQPEPPQAAQDAISGTQPAAPASAQGETQNGAQRPFDAHIVKGKLSATIKKYSLAAEKPASKKQIEYVASLLSKAFQESATGEQDRHLVQKWLTGEESATKFNGAQAKALIDWLTDETGDLGEDGYQEAWRCLNAALEESGQMRLEIPTGPIEYDKPIGGPYAHPDNPLDD